MASESEVEGDAASCGEVTCRLWLMLRVPLSYQADDVDGLAARRDQRDMLILYRENVIDHIVVLNKKFYHMPMQRRGKVTPVRSHRRLSNFDHDV
jgi:hypothetical protein